MFPLFPSSDAHGWHTDTGLMQTSDFLCPAWAYTHVKIYTWIYRTDTGSRASLTQTPLPFSLWEYNSRPVMHSRSWLLYKALHILKAQCLIFNLYLSFLLANFDNVIAADLTLFNIHFYPISPCLPSQEIKLSSSFINVNIISLLFIEFQVTEYGQRWF